MRSVLAALCLWLLIAPAALAQDAQKPVVAVFPLGGRSGQDLRDRIGFSIRAKLDRDGTYAPIDGPAMIDLAAPAKSPINFDTSPDAIKDLAHDSGAAVLIWGDVSPAGGKDLIRLKALDLREKDAAVHAFHNAIADGTEVRFAVERFLQTLPGVGSFQHPNDQPVHHDAASDALFATNPNLVANGDFSQPGHWTAIYQADKYEVTAADLPPGVDQVAIHRRPDGTALEMNLSVHAAQNNGLAALSDPIDIKPAVRYRLSFRYRSNGPRHQVFVKGYTLGKNLAGDAQDIEVYRLQVPPGDQTGGKWITVQADLDPYNPQYPVEHLRVDLYAYLNAGTIEFDKVELKAVGHQPRPATAPAQ